MYEYLYIRKMAKCADSRILCRMSRRQHLDYRIRLARASWFRFCEFTPAYTVVIITEFGTYLQKFVNWNLDRQI